MISIGDTVRINSDVVRASTGVVRDIHHGKRETSYLIEWGSPAYGIPALVWTSAVSKVRTVALTNSGLSHG